uniref:Uncharacterized protein n=1 Tax=Davidia involucrata TaxID=16924 RepID=A0A5B7AEG9_DAVIN
MLSTVGLELSSLINSELTWKKVSKGNRSSGRRARKSVVRTSKASGEFVNKDSKEVDMPVSESEKLGVTVLGCRFSEKAEHVPIKKRRFLFRSPSPSPPPKTPSPCPEETERLVKSLHAEGPGFHPNSISECQLAASETAASADMGQIVDNELNIQVKNSVKVNEQLGDNEDFSGISILAAAACSNSLGDVKEGSGVEESLGREGLLQIPMNAESKADFVNSAEISTEGTGSFISTTPAEEGPPSSRTDNSPPKDLPLENIVEGISLLENSVAESQGLSSEKDGGKITTNESSARDDRLHWDLNTVMDAWEHPFDCQHAESLANVADGISEYADDGNPTDKNGNSEGRESQREPRCADDDIGKTLLPGESTRLVHETQVSNVEEHKLDACTDIDRAISSQEELPYSEIDHAPNVTTDLVRETESLHNQERISPCTGSIASVPAQHASGPSPPAIVNEEASVECEYFRTTGNTENLSSHQVAGTDSFVDCSLPPESNPLTDTSVCEENCNAGSTGVAIGKNIDDCAADSQISVTISSSSLAENQNGTLPIVANSDKATCESGNVQNEDGVGAERITGLHDDGNAIDNMVSMETGQPLGNEPCDYVIKNAVSDPDEMVFSQSYNTNVEMPPFGAFPGSQPSVPVDTKVPRCGVTSVYDTTETDTQVHAEELATTSSGKSMALLGPTSGLSSHDAHRSYSDDVVHSSGKVALEEPVEDGYDSDVSQGDLGPVVGIEKASEHQVDYDSQYEDGELRESSVHLEEYDGEDIETEFVDYGPDNRDTSNLGSEDTQDSNFQPCPGGSLRTQVADAGSGKDSAVRISKAWLRVQNSEKVDSNCRGSGSGPDQVIQDDGNHDRQDNVKEPCQSADLKMKMSGWDQLPEQRAANRIRDGSVRKTFTGDHKDGLDAKDMGRNVVGSRVYRRELPSRIEGPPSCDLFLRRYRLGLQGSSSSDADDTHPRSERESGSVRSFGRGRYIHGRGRGGDRWVDSPDDYRGLKRHRSPTYHGPASFHRSGPDDMKEGVGLGGHAGRQATNASSHVLRRSFRSGSPTDRQETFDMHTSIRPAGEMSPDRCVTIGRGRSVRYGPRVGGGGPKERYHGPVNDECIESSLNYSHPLSRRRRSLSPIGRRGNPRTQRSSSKSPSRSRTRSPNAWQSPRGRSRTGFAGGSGFRHQSRSPNFRPESRMLRLRSPRLRPGFAADHVIGFMSVPRSHGSPPPNSRWVGYKQRSSLLDRRSPGRIGPRGERFDVLDSPRKLKPNEYYRSAHPGRFSELNGAGRGGPRDEGTDDDRRKHGYRYGLVHSVRHYDMDGDVKRFRYDVEDDFTPGHDTHDKDASDFHGRGNPKAYSRGINTRIGNVPRRSRDERGPFLHRRDGKYNANSKSFGIRECDDDIAPRRRRPS